ncbi:MAG: hypothetical protein NTY87_05250 [Planctomycetia bacterium]|nr:hypothetical protein [Planctomycetia bacterium]
MYEGRPFIKQPICGDHKTGDCFPADSFCDFTLEFAPATRQWVRSDGYSGNWYAGDVVGLEMENWLCPALLLYFQTPPQKLFVRCEKLPAGINPIWNPADDARPTTIVSAPKNERRDF